MSLQAAGDVARMVAAGSAPLPPLKAAFELSACVQDSITKYKANRHEVEDLKSFAFGLANLFENAPAHDVESDKVLAFVAQIKNTQVYLEKLATKSRAVQYLTRTSISEALIKQRNNIWECFMLLNIQYSFDSSTALEGAKKAREKDREISHAALRDMNRNIRQIADALGIDGESVEPRAGELQELEASASQTTMLQDMPQDNAGGTSDPTREQVLTESIHLLRVLEPDYNWYTATFKQNYSSSYINGVLGSVIDEIVHQLERRNLIPEEVKTELSYERNQLRKTKELMTFVGRNSRNPLLVRSLQIILQAQPSIQIYLVF
ncbi:hypothetical protein DL96DRAFT_1595016 [Flagelloscypha sp. PMI_526]|nr:hypothetical protein DL96DRAFT_1595016 [Flagelloscypha sp. PMI_526]